MDAKRLLETYGSPLYVYDYAVIKERCENMFNFADSLWSGLPNGIGVSMHYSTKANSNPAILRIVEESGLSVDCMSPLEAELDYRARFRNDRMLYVCNNISAEEMKFVHDKGLLICLDSISQVETWGKLFPGTDIMVRINPGSEGVGHSKAVVTSGKETKFGISKDNLTTLLHTAKLYNLNIIGVHQHLGSLFLNDKIPDYIAGVISGLEIITEYFPEVKIIDLGGGFGVPYRPSECHLNLDEVSAQLIPVLNKYLTNLPYVTEIKFEPGRYIPCEGGFLLGTVTAIKYEYGKYWIGTDIGMNQLVRPSMYQSYHEITAISAATGEPLNKITEAFENVNYVGNICESGDILGKDRRTNLPRVGDIVIVNNAGAYGYSMASNYTGRPRPAEVMINIPIYPSEKLIRKRETIESMMENLV